MPVDGEHLQRGDAARAAKRTEAGGGRRRNHGRIICSVRLPRHQARMRDAGLLLQLAQRILLDQFACEEVRSDTYLKTWNAIPPQRPPVFPAFLSRLTRQGAIDRYRRDGAQKRGAREYLLSLEELGDAVGGEADEALDARLLAESIERYLRTLSPRERGVFLARYFYVDPLADVARQYGTSIGAVKSLLYRTRHGLRAHLEQEGFTV